MRADGIPVMRLIRQLWAVTLRLSRDERLERVYDFTFISYIKVK